MQVLEGNRALFLPSNDSPDRPVLVISPVNDNAADADTRPLDGITLAIILTAMTAFWLGLGGLFAIWVS